MRYHKIPDETIRRLPIYLRALHLQSAQDKASISSKELADMIGVNSWQIRKDFSYFGAFGKPGSGYDIENLKRHIRKILRLDSSHKAALIGVGNLGSAVLAYQGFSLYGFDIVAAYDCDSKKIGRKINGITIEDVTKLDNLRKRNINLAVLTVPESAAQGVVDRLVIVGIKGILNFSPLRIQVPSKVKVLTIDIAMDLARLPYYMT
jgi:redox-sensing transcriptional repressor